MIMQKSKQKNEIMSLNAVNANKRYRREELELSFEELEDRTEMVPSCGVNFCNYEG